MNKKIAAVALVALIAVSGFVLLDQNKVHDAQGKKTGQFQYITFQDKETGENRTLRPVISGWCVQTQRASVELFGLQFCAF